MDAMRISGNRARDRQALERAQLQLVIVCVVVHDGRGEWMGRREILYAPTSVYACRSALHFQFQLEGRELWLRKDGRPAAGV